jgi:hypothetical protein
MDNERRSVANDWNNNKRITGSEKIVLPVTINLGLHRQEQKKNLPARKAAVAK